MNSGASRAGQTAARATTQQSVTLKELRHLCQPRPAQFPTLSHLPTELPCAAELLELGIAATSHLSVHFDRVCLKLPNELLEPSVADAKLPSPFTARWLLRAGGVPEEHISADHPRFVPAAPRAGRAPHRARFFEVSHRGFARRHAARS